ncbi:acyl-CoA dehydrogenase family protein [Amycolatopsis thermoflava]|uniref:Alkylation response protein AidB-like acyl-CoA dehydrogenase n=1 Tax=Amycolatopsis thermoflava TaxID=84480 RepID=A0A3N2G791_9PSEU|nr:acyl-CoA dehydrogenase family protein [Amycolatopsis thermoflava]ROS32069.1 alkylation response protein AidB-like acyl-CoA dehydrogenase [Amycolatopsis thermoflava]
MRWTLTEDQELFRDTFRGWLDRFASSEAVRGWLDTGDPAPFERRFVEEGWFSVGTPESAGGQGGGLLELALASEQLGRTAAPSSAWLASVLAAPVLPAEVAEASLTRGEFAVLAVNSDKPADVAGPVQVADGVLSGTVPLVLGAERAAKFAVPSGGRLYLVDAADARLTKRPLLDRSRSVADVTFDGARGTELGAADLARVALRSAVLVAADSLGAAERMLELAVEYSKQREQFGVPIGSFQAVKHAAATMLVAVESARTLVYYAAASVEQEHEDYALHAAAAKAQVCAAAAGVADSALTLHGAIGYTWEHDLQLFYKRAKLNGRLSGSSSVWNERLAAALPLVPAA